MGMFHTHEVEQSKLLRSKLASWLTGECLAYTTSDASWQKPELMRLQK